MRGELGLDIDAFNQPGVETSKIASFAVLGNTSEKKYTDKAQEMRIVRPLSIVIFYRNARCKKAQVSCLRFFLTIL